MSVDVLTDVQKQALEHIKSTFSDNINPICALDMGLGKTRVACEIIKRMIQGNPLRHKILIVHKASNYMDPWIKELAFYGIVKAKSNKKDDFTNHIYIHGKERKGYLNNGKYRFKAGNILLTSYETLRRDIENDYYDLNDIFDLIVFDELHSIINYKYLTKKSIKINELIAKRKIALTGTPIQNNIKELGLLYIFLNNRDLFLQIISIKENEKIDEADTKEAMTDTLLKNAVNDCIQNRVVFHYDEEKEGFIRNSIILSLPIDQDMYNIATNNFKTLEPKQKMFFSHPASVFKKTDEYSLPISIKSEAVKLILKSTLKDEKVVIFSLFIDVLNVYFSICEKMGYNAIKITGQDKGNKLKEKLTSFKHSSSIKVLLTTLQKSSEGFNFDMATHVIILEFWWNPQKLFQAMSRIDRKTQKRNIFIYLLCYNVYGEIIEEERLYYTIILKKITDALSIYKKIDDTSKVNEKLSKTKELPEIKYFNDISTFHKDFEQYLSHFQHTHRNLITMYDSNGVSLESIRNSLEYKIKDYLQCIELLSIKPWRIIDNDVLGFIKNHINLKINGSIGKTLINKINSESAIYPSNITIDSYYPFVFIKTVEFKMRINSWKEPFFVRYVLGKQKNGRINVISIDFDNTKNSSFIFDLLLKYGISEISTVVVALKEPSVLKHTQDIIVKYYPETKCQLCLTSLYKKFSLSGLSNYDINTFELIIMQRTKKDAHELVDRLYNSKVENFYIYKRLLNYLPTISFLYHYPPIMRSVIGTTNLIEYIAINVQLLLEHTDFHSKEEVWRYIDIASRRIVDDGHSFIPTWDFITQSINVH